jgi:hypothetical protein
MASVPWGTLAPAESTPEVWEALGADGVSLGTISAEADGASPRPGNDTGGLLRHQVMSGADIGAPRSATPGDTIPAPGFSSAASPMVSGLLLSGSTIFPPSAIDWRQVEDDVAFTCSQVTDVERLLHETLASVGRDILRLIRVSLKKVRKACLCPSNFLRVPLLPHVFVFAALVPG